MAIITITVILFLLRVLYLAMHERIKNNGYNNNRHLYMLFTWRSDSCHLYLKRIDYMLKYNSTRAVVLILNNYRFLPFLQDYA